MLSDPQHKILNYIADYMRTEYWSPSIREIAKNLHYASTCAPSVHIKALQAKGLIERKNGNGNAIRLMPAGKEYLARQHS